MHAPARVRATLALAAFVSACAVDTTAPPAANDGITAVDETASVQAIADLQVSATAPPLVVLGEGFFVHVTVKNLSSQPAADVVVTGTMPPIVTGPTVWTGACTPTPPTVVCNVGSLPGGGSWSGFLLVQASAPGTAIFTWTVTSSTPDPQSWNNTGISGTNVTTAPPFSQPGSLPNAEACICLPPYMVVDPKVSHHWWVRAAGGGPLVVSPYAVGVNPAEAGTLLVAVFDVSNTLLGSSTGAHPGSGENALAPISVASPAAGTIYRVTVSVSGAPQGTPQARHYRLKFHGATLAGMHSFSQPQPEHHNARWVLNVNAGESIMAQVFTTGEAGATSATVRLYDPTGALVGSGGIFTLFGFAPVSVGGQYILEVSNANGHYIVSKQAGADPGIYANWQTGGEGAIDLTLALTGGPSPSPVNVTVTDALTGDIVALQPVAGHAVFNMLPAGTYTVTIDAPGGQIVRTVIVTCDGIAYLTVDRSGSDGVGRMTGGGRITVGNGRNAQEWTWGFEIRCDASHGTLEYQDHTGGNFHMESLGRVLCFDDPAIGPAPPQAGFDTMRMSGTGRWNGASGYTIEAEIVDAGEPGTNDRIKITVKNGAGGVVSTVSGRLTGGNHQAHR